MEINLLADNSREVTTDDYQWCHGTDTPCDDYENLEVHNFASWFKYDED